MRASSASAALIVLGLIAEGCAPPGGVYVTRKPTAVAGCTSLGEVRIPLNQPTDEAGLRRQTAERGGNYLLLLTTRSGEAYVCTAKPQPDVDLPGTRSGGPPRPTLTPSILP